MEIEIPPSQPLRKRKRASRSQRAHLVETLWANLDIVKATDSGLTATPRVAEFWIRLTRELNSMGGTWARNVKEWQKVWRLWCSKLRTKCRRISAGIHAIDKEGHISTEEKLNEVEKKIFEIISRIEYNDLGSLKKQRPDSTGCPSESTVFRSSYLVENKEVMESRKRSSLEASTLSSSSNVECRVCLKYVCCEDQCCDIFGPWNQNPEATISCYFTQVTNIQVSPSDKHTKYICFKCLDLLQNCVLFIAEAQHSEAILQERYEDPTNNDSDSLWPRPIQVDKCLNNDNMIEIEVKQEVLSEDEVPVMEADNEELKMDIKVEPEEYSSYDCSPQIMDTISITPIPENEIINNSLNNNSQLNTYEDETYLDEHIKEEPQSDDESEVPPDLPLDCMLCTKTFHSVPGLKAHVIAQHSYLTIARKTEDHHHISYRTSTTEHRPPPMIPRAIDRTHTQKKVTPPVYKCFTCKSTLLTRTDLIVHETCHGEYTCYVCYANFDTFMLLTKHREICINNGDHLSRVKTLDDVKRPSPDRQHTVTSDLTGIRATNTKELQRPKTSNKVDLNNKKLMKKSQKMHTKAGDSTKTKLKSRKINSKAVNSTNAKESQKLYHPQKEPTKTELKSQKTHHFNAVDSITELESQKMHHPQKEDSTETESKSNKTHNSNAVDSNTELEFQKIYLPIPEDITNSKSTESQSKVVYQTSGALKEEEYHETNEKATINSTDTESQELQTVVQYIVDSTQKSSVKTTHDNSSQDSNIPNANRYMTEENNSITKQNNTNSKINSIDSEVNLDLNNFNSESDNSNSEFKNTNCETTNHNQNLTTISTESKNVNITNHNSNDINKDLNSPDSETNIKIELSSELSQRQRLDIPSISPKLESSTKMATRNFNIENNAHVIGDQNMVSEQSNLALDSSNTVSKISNLETDKEPVVEVNKTISQAECANMLEVSEHSVDNTPHIDAENDSMEIHLAIHSLKKESLDDVNIDEEMIETTESNDKVLQ